MSRCRRWYALILLALHNCGQLRDAMARAARRGSDRTERLLCGSLAYRLLTRNLSRADAVTLLDRKVHPRSILLGWRMARRIYASSRSPGTIGLDRSVPEQYLRTSGGCLDRRLRPFPSMTSNPVLSDLMHFFPATLELATVATIIGVALGIPAGVAAGAMRGRWPESFRPLFRLVRLFHAVFWLGSSDSGCFTPNWAGLPGPAAST